MDPLDDGDQLLVAPGWASIGAAEKVAAANAARVAEAPAGGSGGPSVPKKPAPKKPAHLPTPAIGGGEMGGGSGSGNGSRHAGGGALDKLEKEMRAAYDNHGKYDAILNVEED
jgi:hypothetical protein